jgi:hypothetical protein
MCKPWRYLRKNIPGLFRAILLGDFTRSLQYLKIITIYHLICLKKSKIAPQIHRVLLLQTLIFIFSKLVSVVKLNIPDYNQQAFNISTAGAHAFLIDYI